MAEGNFDVHLPIDGQIISAPVYNPGPSPLDAVLNTVSNGLRQFEQDSDERARRRKADETARVKAREEDARGFLFDSALKYEAEFGRSRSDPWLGLVEGNTPMTVPTAPTSDSPDPATAIIDGAVQSGATTAPRMGELEQTVGAQAEEVTNIETGISQGTMPRTARDAAVDRMLLETRNLFPDVDTEVIVAMMEKMGLKTTMFYDIQRAYSDRSAIDDSRAEATAAAHTRGMEVLGTAAAGMTQEQIIASGMADIQRERQTAEIKEQLEIQRTQGELTDQEITRNREDAGRQIQQITIQSAMDSFAPLINSAQELLTVMGQNVGSNPAAEEQFTETMAQLKMRLPVLIENYANQVYTSTGDSEQADHIRESLTRTFENTIIKPLESRDADFTALSNRLQTNLGLKVSQAYPFIAMIKAMGVDLQLTDTLLEQLDPATRQRLAQEISNVVTTDIYSLRQRESAQMQIAEIVSVLQGDTTLNQLNLSPDQLRQRFRTIDRTTTALTPRLASGDLNQQDAWLNGMSEIAVAAGQLNRTSSTLSIGNAIASLTGYGSGDVFDTLISSGNDPERAQIVGIGARAAVARGMQGLINKYGLQSGSHAFGDGYVVRYRNGKWEYTFDINTVPGGNRQGVQNQLRLGRVSPSNEVRVLTNSLNNAGNFLVNSADWDEGAPKGTPAELRAWYNQGKPPKSMIQELERQRQNTGPDAVMRALNSFEEVLQNGDFSLSVPTRAGPGGLEIDAEGNAVLGQDAQAMAATASSLGYSRSVVAGLLANVQHESSFNPGQSGDGGTAFGYFQHRDERVENFQRVTGVHPSQATPEQAIKFFDWEMKHPAEAGMSADEVNAIKNAPNAQVAAMLIQRHYERPLHVDPARGQTAMAFSSALYGGSR